MKDNKADEEDDLDAMLDDCAQDPTKEGEKPKETPIPTQTQPE